MTTVTLISSENQAFTIPVEIANFSMTLREQISDLGTEMPIPLDTVSSRVLQKMIELGEYRLKNPLPVEPEKIIETKMPLETAEKEEEKPINPWILEYSNIDDATIFEILIASNYLDHKEMLQIFVSKIGNVINEICKKNKLDDCPRLIRERFSIPEDLTPEEVTEIKEKMAWCRSPEDETDGKTK